MVRQSTGKTNTMSVLPSYTIENLQFMIYGKENILPEKQLLIFEGKKLRAEFTISDYNIVNNSVIEFSEVDVNF